MTFCSTILVNPVNLIPITSQINAQVKTHLYVCLSSHTIPDIYAKQEDVDKDIKMIKVDKDIKMIKDKISYHDSLCNAMHIQHEKFYQNEQSHP